MKNQDKDIHKKLIEEYLDTPGERLATESEIQHMKGVVGKKILNDLTFSDREDKKTPQKKPDHDIQKYLIPLPKNTHRTYNPELEAARDSMEANNERYDSVGTMKDIEYILNHYRDLLSLDDTINIYLLMIHRRLEIPSEENKQGLDNTLALLEHLNPYEQHMDTQQKDDFQYYVGVACYCKAGFTQSKFFYKKAVDAFNIVLFAEHRNTYNKHAGENLLSDERYKEILYYKINALHGLGEPEPIIKPTLDFLDACGWNPKTSNSLHPEEKKLIANVLFIQGTAYEFMNLYDDAIQSYEQYLIFKPDDEFIKNHIKFLKSKKNSK